MKLNVGDYVRTNQGYISKVENIVDDYIWFDNTIYRTYSDSIDTLSEEDIKEHIIKTSSKIIDLLSSGDIVINQLGEIIRITSGNIDELKDYWKICENPIKSIVTKEQFESMQYVVKED